MTLQEIPSAKRLSPLPQLIFVLLSGHADSEIENAPFVAPAQLGGSLVKGEEIVKWNKMNNCLDENIPVRLTILI
jgi:hypothetical protein